jgi:hypothetical protein
MSALSTVLGWVGSLAGKLAGAVPATTAVASVGGVTITAGGLKEALDVLQAVQDKLGAFAASPSIDGALDVTEAVLAELNALGIAGAKLDETVIIIAKAVYDASQNANGDYSGTIVTYPHRAK